MVPKQGKKGMRMKKRLIPIVLAMIAFTLGLCGCNSSKTPGDGRVVTLESRFGRVEIDLVGARILSWRSAGKEIFFMPSNPQSPDGDWSHGGLSICWPWFGKKGSAASSIHGFARNKTFVLKSRRTSAIGSSVTLGLTLAAGEEPEFPYAASLELTFTLTDRLTATMRTLNTGKESFAFSGGFQPYFAVGSYKAVTLQGVKDADFTAVDGMDAAFPRRGDAFALTDASIGQKISATAKGNTSLIVWSPGSVEPHNRNLAPGDTERFIGLGPAFRAKEGAITLSPGQAHELVFELKIQK
jgi:glucose-6-phosphate 1-epimerase